MLMLERRSNMHPDMYPTLEPTKRFFLTWDKRYPKKKAAHVEVASAIREGRLVRQPCVECGQTNRVNAHHCNYDKPLEVMWLCSLHHTWWHQENGPGLNGD